MRAMRLRVSRVSRGFSDPILAAGPPSFPKRHPRVDWVPDSRGGLRWGGVREMAVLTAFSRFFDFFPTAQQARLGSFLSFGRSEFSFSRQLEHFLAAIISLATPTDGTGKAEEGRRKRRRSSILRLVQFRSCAGIDSVGVAAMIVCRYSVLMYKKQYSRRSVNSP